MTPVGLRIDVDTFRGTRDGVPRLLTLLDTHGITATFFFTVGPDNMGRHLWRMLDPVFLVKMLRSRAASLYGWDILLAGTCWPGRHIARSLGQVMRDADAAGHEIGFYAWDHHRWQLTVDRMPPDRMRQDIERGVRALTDVLGRPPSCSAVAGWRVTERVLQVKEQFGFCYNSDCRSQGVFQPVVEGRLLTPQIPTTLPTYDELIGRDDVTNEAYNTRLLERIRPGQLNVLTVHAEVEGIACAEMFKAFLQLAEERDVRFVPLGELLEPGAPLPVDTLALGPVTGRAGAVGWQRSAFNA